MTEKDLGKILLYLTPILTIAVAATIDYFKERRTKIKWWLLLVPIFGAIVGFFGSYHSDKEKERADSTAVANDLLYKKQLSLNLGKSIQISEDLGKSIKTAKKQLDSTSKVLSAQRQEAEALSRQLVYTKQLLNTTSLSLRNSNKSLIEFQRLQSPINNIRFFVSLVFRLDNMYFSGNSKDLNNHGSYMANLNILLFDKRFTLSPGSKIEDNSLEIKKIYTYKNSYIVKKFNTPHDSLLVSLNINHGLNTEQSELNDFFPPFHLFDASLFDKIMIQNNDLQGKNSHLIVTYQAAPDKNQVVYKWGTVDLIKRQVNVWVEFTPTKTFGDNILLSSKDLNGKYFNLFIISNTNYECEFARIQFGDNYSSSLDIPKQKIQLLKNSVLLHL
ncbi:hypothetical protein GCM10027037_02860 [Mucilaginibacter koreensis]